MGVIEWQKTFGGIGIDKAYSVGKTSDNGFIVAGQTESFGAGAGDVWVLKLDANGVIEWERVYYNTRR